MVAAPLSLFFVVICIHQSLAVYGFLLNSNGLVRKAQTSPVQRQNLKIACSGLRSTIRLFSEIAETTQVYSKKKERNRELNEDERLAQATCEKRPLNGSDVRIGVIMTRSYGVIVKNLYKSVNNSLLESGVMSSNIFTTSVPGPYELPVTAKLLAASKRVDVIIALGCLTRDDNIFQFAPTAAAVANGLMQVSLDTMIPCIHGVLTASSLQEAIQLTGSDTSNPGAEWGKAAVEMGLNRMSAMGLGGKSASIPFVTFQEQLPAAEQKGESAEQKKFGF